MIITTVRERAQLLEEQVLSPYATLSKKAQSRNRLEEEYEMCTPFQRDHDRIIHCKTFRRLKRKVQVFLSPGDDRYRTRLIHTPEVSQIVRAIAHGLLLNEGLVETISPRYDLGHTPLGHADERVLNELCEHGFRHNEQSVRVMKKLENEGRGLNLTREVRDGILCHTSGTQAQTPERRIVHLADKIVHINHDIDDAVRAGILPGRDIPEHITSVFGARRSVCIGAPVKSVIRASDGAEIRMKEHTSPLLLELCQFMSERVYFNPYAKKEEEKVPFLIKTLFEYMKNPAYLLLDLHETAELERAERAAADFVAGMTDRYTVMLFRDVSVPGSWDHRAPGIGGGSVSVAG